MNKQDAVSDNGLYRQTASRADAQTSLQDLPPPEGQTSHGFGRATRGCTPESRPFYRGLSMHCPHFYDEEPTEYKLILAARREYRQLLGCSVWDFWPRKVLNILTSANTMQAMKYICSTLLKKIKLNEIGHTAISQNWSIIHYLKSLKGEPGAEYCTSSCKLPHWEGREKHSRQEMAENVKTTIPKKREKCFQLLAVALRSRGQ